MRSHDVIGLANTSTGKAAAFVLPMLNYGQFMKFHSAALYDDADVHKQVQRSQRSVDILIAAPERLFDILLWHSWTFCMFNAHTQ